MVDYEDTTPATLDDRAERKFFGAAKYCATEGGIAATPQPDPKRGGRSCTVLVIDDLMRYAGPDLDKFRDKVIIDLIARDEMGFKKYGQNLETYDGRNTLVDAYQEALDLLQYLRKYREELGHPALQSIYFHAMIACLRIRQAISSMPGGKPVCWVDVETQDAPDRAE